MKTNLDKDLTPMCACLTCAALILVAVEGPVGGALATVICLSIPLVELVLKRLDADANNGSGRK